MFRSAMDRDEGVQIRDDQDVMLDLGEGVQIRDRSWRGVGTRRRCSDPQWI